MGAIAAALMSVEEFEQLPEEFGIKRELIEGELLEVSHGLFGHEEVKSVLVFHVVLHSASHPDVWLLAETEYAYGGSRVIPDLSLIRTKDRKVASPDRHCDVPLLVAFEVVSSESADALERKSEIYFRHGARAMVVCYPMRRYVQVWRPDDTRRVFRESQALELPDVLPGFQMPVSALFENLPVESAVLHSFPSEE